MAMPNRPRAHQLETLSVRKFEALLPVNWVYLIPNDDYGIDGEIEIFMSMKSHRMEVLSVLESY